MGFRKCVAVSLLCMAAASLQSCGNPEPLPPPPAVDAEIKDEKTVNLYIVSDYLAPDTIANFETRSGITVHVSYFDNPDTMEARMLAGHSHFDVVLSTSGTFLRQLHSDTYLPLDKTRLPNLRNLDPAIMAKVAASDPDNAHAIVYTWGTYGIGVNKKLIGGLLPKMPPIGWRLVFDPRVAAKLAPCGITFTDDSIGIVELALKYLRRDPAALTDQDFVDVEKLLLAVRPYVRNIDSSGDIDAMARGDACISVAYSGDFVQASKRAEDGKNDVQLDYVIPADGSLMWFDLLAIPRDAPHVANAYRLLDYLMDPHVMAGITNVIGFANGNAAATTFLEPSTAANTAIYPTPEELKRLFVQSELTPDQAHTIARIWQRFKAGK